MMETENSSCTVTSIETAPCSSKDATNAHFPSRLRNPTGCLPAQLDTLSGSFLEDVGTLSPEAVHASHCDSPCRASPVAEMQLGKETDSCCSDARKTRRKNKRKLASDFCCPVCGVTVREQELAAHYSQEVDKLAKISVNMMKLRPRKPSIKTSFIQVKANRENRTTAKLGEYTAKASQAVQCSICRLKMTGSQENIDKHIAFCVQNEDDEDDEYVVVDTEEFSHSFGEYGPYTICPLTSLRTTSPKQPHNEESEDEVVEVDLDDKKNYGEPQYSELDVFINTLDGDTVQLRQAVMGGSPSQSQNLEPRKWGNIIGVRDRGSLSSSIRLPTDNTDGLDGSNTSKSCENAEALDQTVTSLKEKIQEMENEMTSKSNTKCLICMEQYTKPVVSTTCWHVYCEECWLMTMGVKKLCPQCNMIVFPTDLRKIYL